MTDRLLITAGLCAEAGESGTRSSDKKAGGGALGRKPRKTPSGQPETNLADPLVRVIHRRPLSNVTAGAPTPCIVANPCRTLDSPKTLPRAGSQAGNTSSH